MTAPTPQYLCYIKNDYSQLQPGAAWTPVFSDWFVGGSDMTLIDVSVTPWVVIGAMSPAGVYLFSRIDDLGPTATLDQIKARIESDLIAILAGTYTPIDSSSDVPLPDTGYPFYDPAWFPQWVLDLSTPITADEVTFFWI